jgi:hypothetical protein
MILRWSKNGDLLIEVKLGEFICVSKDCAHLFKFSASLDSTTLEMIYQSHHISLFCEGDLVIVTSDSSVRWKLAAGHLVPFHNGSNSTAFAQFALETCVISFE